MRSREEMSSVVLHLPSLFSLVIFFLLFYTGVGEARISRRSLIIQSCSSSCGEIRNISYPFRLKSDPSNCGDPRFELSCENNKTIFDHQLGKYYVKWISYVNRTIHLVDVNFLSGNCNLPYRSVGLYDLQNAIPFNCTRNKEIASFVNCSKANINSSKYVHIPCLSTGNTSLVYITLDFRPLDLPSSCSLVSFVPLVIQPWKCPSSYQTFQKLFQKGFELCWSKEIRGKVYDYTGNKKFCSLFSKDRRFISSCSGILRYLAQYIGNAIGLRIILAAMFIVVLIIYKLRKKWKTFDAVEKFLRNQQTLVPKRYSYTDIIGMTSHFREKLGQGGFGSVYKGETIGCSMAIKLLGNSKCNGEDFINEVATIGRIHHVNVVKLIGFCSEGSNRALVYEYMPNGSLDKYIFSKEARRRLLSWEKLHDIALGTAKGIEYLHRGCAMCILHFDIKPHNILLDHSFTPKVSDFGLSKLYPKEHDFVSFSTTRGTIGYIAPELISRNFGVVSDKSDVYSFGMLLLEMAGGRKNVDVQMANLSEIYFPSWVYDQLVQGRELNIENATEIEIKIAKKLCIVGLWCIQMKSVDRPSMSKVIEMLEENLDNLQMPPKPVLSSPQQISRRGSHSDSSSIELITTELE